MTNHITIVPRNLLVKNFILLGQKKKLLGDIVLAKGVLGLFLKNSYSTLNLNMQYFYEDGTSNIFVEKGDEATTFIKEKSCRLRKLTDLRKYIKNTEVHFKLEEPEDIMMEETPLEKERATQYNIFTDEDCRRYFYFMSEKLMTPKEAAKAANVNYDTARKWKQIYDRDPGTR